MLWWYVHYITKDTVKEQAGEPVETRERGEKHSVVGFGQRKMAWSVRKKLALSFVKASLEGGVNKSELVQKRC